MWGQATPKTPAVGFDLNRLSVGAIELGYDWQMVAEAFVKDHVLITDPSSLQTVAKRLPFKNTPPLRSSQVVGLEPNPQVCVQFSNLGRIVRAVLGEVIGPDMVRSLLPQADHRPRRIYPRGRARPVRAKVDENYLVSTLN